MARCTKCNGILPFLKVGFLSKQRNTVECQRCGSILKGDERQLQIIGAIGGGVGGLAGFATVYSFLGGSTFALPLLIGTLAIAPLAVFVQNSVVRFTERKTGN